MKKNLGFALVCGLVFAVIAQAAETDVVWHRWPPPQPVCNPSVVTSATLSKQVVDSLALCTLVPLTMQRTNDGDLTVDSWVGGYQRVAQMLDTYQYDQTDSCSGAFLGSYVQTLLEPQTLMFNIANPNLDPSLPSYVQNAPLTSDEAQAELPAVLAQCQAVQTGVWPQQ